MPSNARIKRLLEALTSKEQDAVYKHVKYEHTLEDIKSHLNDMGEELTDKQIEHVAERFVYQCDYDCNQSYWDNIETLIREELED